MYATQQTTATHPQFCQTVNTILDCLNKPYRIGFGEQDKAINVVFALESFINAVQPSESDCRALMTQLVAKQSSSGADLVKLLPSMPLISGVGELFALMVDTMTFSETEKHSLQPVLNKILSHHDSDQHAKLHYALIKKLDVPEAALQDYFLRSIRHGHIQKVTYFLRQFPDARCHKLTYLRNKVLPVELANRFKQPKLLSLLAINPTEVAAAPKVLTQAELAMRHKNLVAREQALTARERALNAREQELTAQIQKLEEIKRVLQTLEGQLQTARREFKPFKPS